MARLGTLAGTMAGAARAVEEARAAAGRLARFDLGPEAVQASRVEAAAERGMFRAIRLILAINREAGRGAAGAGIGASAGELMASLGSFGAGVERPTPPTPTGRPGPAVGDRREALASFRPGIGEELTSFRVGIAPGATGDLGGGAAAREGRPRRPDVRKLAGARR